MNPTVAMPAQPKNCVCPSRVRLIEAPNPWRIKLAQDWQESHKFLRHSKLTPAHAPVMNPRPAAA
jgi:hypothetical protein